MIPFVSAGSLAITTALLSLAPTDYIVTRRGPAQQVPEYYIAPSIERRSERPKALDPLSATKQFLAQRYERDISDHEVLSVIENIRLIFSLLEEEARRVDRA